MKDTGRTLLVLALTIGAALYLTGITWGVPTEERAGLYFADRESRDAAIKAAADYVDEGDWRRSHMAPEDTQVVRHRTTFNIIRSLVPDEQDIIKPLAGMNPKKLDFNPHRFAYPALMTYMVGGALGAAAVIGQATVIPNLNHYFMNPEDFGRFYVVGRLVVVLFALLCIWMTYKLGRELYSVRIGGLAALLLAVSPIWAIDAHYLKIDIPGTFWMLCTIWATWKFWERPTLGRLALAGAFAGLAAGTKYNFGIIILTPVAVGLWRGARVNAKFAASVIPVLAVASLATFLISNPYIALSFPEFLQDFRYAASVVTGGESGGESPSRLNEWLFYFVHALPASLGWPLYAAVVTGLIFAAVKPGRREALVATFVVPFGLFLLITEVKLSSYLLPLLPIAAIFAAVALVRIHDDVLPRRGGIILAVAVVLLAFWASAAEVSLFTRTNTRDQAAQWIAAEIEPGTTIALPAIPIAFHTPAINAEKYDVRILGDGDSVAALRPEIAVITEYFAPEDHAGEAKTSFERIVNALENGPYAKSVFKEEPRFLGLERPHARLLPQDWIHPAPIVTIYRRTEDF